MISEQSQEVLYQIDYRKWIGSIVGWDGLMPILLLFLPSVMGFFIPNNPDLLSFFIVVLLILAFVIRFYLGRRRIRENSCGTVMRYLQFLVFSVGIFILLITEIMICLVSFFVKGNPRLVNGGVIWIVLFIIAYLALMTFSLYPGKSVIIYEEKNVFDKV